MAGVVLGYQKDLDALTPSAEGREPGEQPPESIRWTRLWR